MRRCRITPAPWSFATQPPGEVEAVNKELAQFQADLLKSNGEMKCAHQKTSDRRTAPAGTPRPDDSPAMEITSE
jgi:hypothetical protein